MMARLGKPLVRLFAPSVVLLGFLFLSPTSGQAVSSSCLSLGFDSGTLPCVVNGNDVFSGLDPTHFSGGTHPVGQNGSDTEANVEAGLNFVTGSFLDLIAVATDLTGTAGAFTFTPSSLTGGQSFTWAYSGPDLLAFLTVKGANSFQLFDISGQTSGSGTTAGILNRGGQTPNVGHGSFWTQADPPPAQAPEPGTLLLLGSGLVGLHFVKRWREG